MGTMAPRRAGFVFVEILLVIVIIGLLIGGYYGLSASGKHQAETKSTPAQAIEKAKSVECANNLNQLRQLIQMYLIDHDAYPREFDPGQQGSMGRCPVSGRPYVYDPQTGTIHCTTPGHESL